MELLIGYDSDAFAASGDPARDLLQRDAADWEVVEDHIGAGKLVELAYQGHRFYMRALPGRRSRTAKEARDAPG